MKRSFNRLKQWIFSSAIARKFLLALYRLSGSRAWSPGYSVHKFNIIRAAVEDNLDLFKAGKLPANYGRRLDERVIEYPWLFARLPDSAQIILDAGSSLNHAAILSLPCLNNRRLYISTLYYEGFIEKGTPHSYVFEDIRQMCYRDNFFDAVVSISTLEHIGMDNTFLYTPDSAKKENNKCAYLEAVKEFKRVVKQGGSLYLTVPYGRYKDLGWMQVFDAGMVEAITDLLRPSYVSAEYFKYENNQWNFSDALACKGGFYFDIHREGKCAPDSPAASQCIVCLEMRV